MTGQCSLLLAGLVFSAIAPCATTPSALLAETPLAAQTLQVKVSAAGEITDVYFPDDAPAPLRSGLDKAVRSWRFSPKRVDGAPVPWASQLLVKLAAVPNADGFRLRIVDVAVNPFAMKTTAYPAYPTRMLVANRSAAVCVEVASVNGKSSLLRSWVDGKPAAKSNEFAKAAAAVVPRWELSWPIIDGRTYADTHVFMPVNFATGRRSADAIPVKDDACADEIVKDAGNLVLLSKPQGNVL